MALTEAEEQRLKDVEAENARLKLCELFNAGFLIHSISAKNRRNLAKTRDGWPLALIQQAENDMGRMHRQRAVRRRRQEMPESPQIDLARVPSLSLSISTCRRIARSRSGGGGCVLLNALLLRWV